MTYAEFRKIQRLVRKNSKHLRVETKTPHDATGHSVPLVIRFTCDRKEK